MDYIKVQQELDKIYQEELNIEKLKELFKATDEDEKVDITKISAPHILKVDENYCNADIKVIFVGKETNKWWGKLDDFINTPNSLEVLKLRYEAEFIGGKVPKAKNLKEFETYKAEDWNNLFLKKYKELRDNYFPGLLWAELLKMDSGAKGSSRNAIGIKPIEDISISIFKKELEVLKPDFIIFTTSTGQGYDRIIKEIFNDYETDTSLYYKYNLWKFKSKIYGCTCFRTRHPNATRIKHAQGDEKYSVNEYYQMIVKDIHVNLNKSV